MNTIKEVKGNRHSLDLQQTNIIHRLVLKELIQMRLLKIEKLQQREIFKKILWKRSTISKGTNDLGEGTTERG